MSDEWRAMSARRGALYDAARGRIKSPSHMKILALDTSNEYCSVALWRDGDVDAMDEHAGQTHSQRLLPMADELLRRHGLAVKGLDGIAFGEGPGTFTGLRIACGVTQGLAFGASLPVVGVSTLL